MSLLEPVKSSMARLRWLKSSSFTLVELLVVIAIIAILATLILYAGGTAIRMGQRAKAANTATQIQTAVLAYYTEYSVYPAPYSATAKDYQIGDTALGNDNFGTVDTSAWGTLICILCGNVQPSNPGTAFAAAGASITNSRGIAFLSLRSSDVDTYNAPLNPLPTGTGVNTEKYFNIAIDSDYDGILGVGASAVTTMPKFTPAFTGTGGGSSTAGVAVWANCNSVSSTTNGVFYVHTY